MKLNKKKITFIAVIGAVVIFIITYSILAFGEDDSQKDELQQTQVPVLENPIDDYTSRLDAVDDLKEVRQTNAPSIYDEKYLDSTGVFDPDFLEKEKIRKVDSIYNNSRIDYSTNTYKNRSIISNRDSIVDAIAQKKVIDAKNENTAQAAIDAKEMGLEQQLFFASNPLPDINDKEYPTVQVIVDKKQVIKVNDRLEMRTLNDITIDGYFVPRNTPVFGIVSFKPNRVLLEIQNIAESTLTFKAFDLGDRLEGIYIENSFREELKQQVVGDVIDDINITGVPQVTGIKRIFQRSNRQVKVEVNPNYILTLKVYTRQ